MKSFIQFFLLINLFFSCAQSSSENSELNSNENLKGKDSLENKVNLNKSFDLEDFYSDDKTLEEVTNHAFSLLSNHQKVAQLIMPAIGKHGQTKETIDKLVKEEKIGGVLMLNGTKEMFTEWINEFNAINDSLNAPIFLYSADAEPSLVNRKVRNTNPVAKANTLKSEKEVCEVAETISKDLNEIGINYNFAPVVDMSPNETVGWRSFGHQPDSVIPWSNAFIKKTQEHGVIATAKHFPGHGYVVGDTHEKLVYIDGEMREVKNYPDLIADGLLSIMIAHIAVKNNLAYSTDGLPATTSRKIVTELLKDSLGFKGLIVTDALNMGGVKSVPKADLLAVQAGCDIILMPLNANKAHELILNAYENDELTRKEVDESARKILRMKICLGWNPYNKN